MNRTVVSVVFSLAISAPALAQHEQHSGIASNERLGTVHFETSCAPAVRAEFDRAVALLHSFEFRSAMDGLNRVLERDPSCAVAYWGIALCHWGNPFAGLKSGPLLERGRAAAEKGLATGSPSPRERAYIEAASQLFKDASTISHRDRTLAYEEAMEQLQRDFPKDTEARIFHALAVSQTALPTDKTYANQLKAGAILEPLFKQQPDHPGLAHYIIHAYDVPTLAPKALEAAKRYATIAPSAPHALHMPSHTFTRVGYWEQSIETNIKSAESALKQGVVAEALHAMDYQTYAYLQLAQDEKARKVLERVPEIVAKFDASAMGSAAPPVAGMFAVAAIPARYALERGAWADAAALQPRPSPSPYVEAITYFARAIGAARSGNPGAATSDIDRLAALRDKLTEMKDTYWAEQVDIQRRVALAWAAYAEGRKDEAVQMLRAAADAEDATDKSAVTPGPLAPARELLGFMLLDAGNAGDALVAFEATMKKEPNRLRGVYGAAAAAEKVGDRTRAGQYYRRVLEIAKAADTERPELQRARAFLGAPKKTSGSDPPHGPTHGVRPRSRTDPRL